MKSWGTGCSLNIVFFWKFCDSSELCQFCCSAGVLPALCLYTHWHQGKTEKDQSPEYSKISGKNTIFKQHPVSYDVSSVKIYVSLWYKATSLISLICDSYKKFSSIKVRIERIFLIFNESPSWLSFLGEKGENHDISNKNIIFREKGGFIQIRIPNSKMFALWQKSGADTGFFPLIFCMMGFAIRIF